MMALLDPVTRDPNFRWSPRHARHLLNRAGFGVPPSSIAKLAAMSPEKAVAMFVDYERFPDNLPKPDWLPANLDRRALQTATSSLPAEEKKKVQREMLQQTAQYMSKLQVWWIDRMCHTQRPLEEKIALFWHGHFATSAEKVRDSEANYELNQIFRQMGTGGFRDLVLAVGKSAAMMRYLDQDRSNKQKPNENWARELMELFTLGIGNYTEKDIKEGARSFTGWTVTPDRQFRFNPRIHDEGNKTFLGRTGPFKGEDIVDIILAQPACAEFIVTKLWKFFAYDEPEKEIVQGLAANLRASNYNIRTVLQRMFLSQAFYSDKAIQTQVKSPAQLVVNLLVMLDAPLDEKPPIAQLAMRAMGQSLFSPPNVKGWEGGRTWINTNTLMIRYNFSSYLVSGVVPEIAGQRSNLLKNRTVMQPRQPVQNMEGEMPNGERMGGDMTRDGEPAPRMAGMASGDGGMMSDDSMETRTMGAAGQDAMPRDVAAQTLYEAMRNQRRRRNGSGGDKPNPTEEKLDSMMSQAPFHARDFFSRYEGMTPAEVVDDMSNYFLGMPLDDEQRGKLIQVLAEGMAPERPIAMPMLPERNLRAAVQLMLSTVEFQVC